MKTDAKCKEILTTLVCLLFPPWITSLCSQHCVPRNTHAFAKTVYSSNRSTVRTEQDMSPATLYHAVRHGTIQHNLVPTSLAVWEEVVESARGTHQPVIEAEAYRQLYFQHLFLENMRLALYSAQHAEVLYEKIGCTRGANWARLAQLACISPKTNSEHSLEALLTASRTQHDSTNVHFAYQIAFQEALLRQDYAKAQEQISLMENWSSDPEHKVVTLREKARLAIHQEAFEEANLNLRQALSMVRALRDESGEAEMLYQLAIVSQGKRAFSLAKRYLSKAQRLAERRQRYPILAKMARTELALLEASHDYRLAEKAAAKKNYYERRWQEERRSFGAVYYHVSPYWTNQPKEVPVEKRYGYLPFFLALSSIGLVLLFFFWRRTRRQPTGDEFSPRDTPFKPLFSKFSARNLSWLSVAPVPEKIAWWVTANVSSEATKYVAPMTVKRPLYQGVGTQTVLAASSPEGSARTPHFPEEEDPTPKGSDDAATQDPFIESVKRLIEGAILDPAYGVEQLCKETNLSQSQLFRKIKAHTGFNPKQYIQRIRLENALRLLQDKKLNISEIAYQVGYSDPNYFSRVFHKYFGVTPTHARQAT